MYILNPKFGSEIKARRRQKKLTQAKLAEMINISTRYLQYIENEGHMPDYGVLGAILYELDIPVDIIFVVKQPRL